MPLFKQHTKSYKRAYTVHHSIKGYFAIRKGDWKLVMCAGSGGWTAPQTAKPGDGLAPVQLYNIKTDPFETNNVEAAHPHIVRKLKKQLSECIVNGRSTKGAPQDE